MNRDELTLIADKILYIGNSLEIISPHETGTACALIREQVDLIYKACGIELTNL